MRGDRADKGVDAIGSICLLILMCFFIQLAVTMKTIPKRSVAHYMSRYTLI